jgi:phosphatidylglycerophosphate synthase
MRHPSAAPRVTLAAVQDLARKRPEQEFALNRLYGAHVSPWFTIVCLRLGLSPDQVTLLGALTGAIGVALLLPPLGPWSIAGVVLLQIGYILDFSDGQVARITGRTSNAGAYLDWLTHFYVPVAAVLAMSAGFAWSSGLFVYLVLGLLAALELASFAFSCKEHILVSMGRLDARLWGSGAFHAALADDARPSDALEAPAAAAVGGVAAGHGGIAGRAHAPTMRSLVGEFLIYPGAVHVMTVAVIVDTLAFPTAPVGLRSVALVAWAGLLAVHLPLTVRRNHAVIRAVEARAGGEAASTGDEPG